MRRLLLAAATICAVGLSMCAGTALADAGAVSQLQVAIDSNAVTQNTAWSAAATGAAQATAAREHVVILQAWETNELEAIKAANPSTIVLMYQNASSASTSASATGIYATGVSYRQASANGWLLKNTSGQPFTFQGENWLYATDIGSTAYQSAWAANVIAKLDAGPWDGVFLDDVNPTIAYHYCVSCVAKYPSDATYSAAMGSFVAAVGPQIQAAGKLAVANIGSWSGFGSTVDPWLQSLSGAMDEQFLKWGTTAGAGYAAPATWRTQLQELALTQSEHKLFLGVTHSAAGDEQAALYGYATELLAGEGDASFSLAADYTNATWFPEYDYALGAPTGAYSVTSSGVYQRTFADGLALVNPTGSSQTVTLGGSYSGSGLSHVSTVTMAPQSGLVLMPDAGTTTSTPGSGSTGSSGGSSAGSGSATPPAGSGTATPTAGPGPGSTPPSSSGSATTGGAVTGSATSSPVTTGAGSTSTMSAAHPARTHRSHRRRTQTRSRRAHARARRAHRRGAHARRTRARHARRGRAAKRLG
jgi:hypothetical protein